MPTLTFETIIHFNNGKSEVYYEHGDTPQALEALHERAKDYPNGRKELFQHADGCLRDTPPNSPTSNSFGLSH